MSLPHSPQIQNKYSKAFTIYIHTQPHLIPNKISSSILCLLYDSLTSYSLSTKFSLIQTLLFFSVLTYKWQLFFFLLSFFDLLSTTQLFSQKPIYIATILIPPLQSCRKLCCIFPKLLFACVCIYIFSSYIVQVTISKTFTRSQIHIKIITKTKQ